LVRVVRLHDGSLAVGRSGTGRGAWLCRDSPGCIDRAEKRKAFDRALRGPVQSEQVDRLRSALMPDEGSEGSVL
jgi:predicted RNA-binding protein YlxR (DUF448 family)